MQTNEQVAPTIYALHIWAKLFLKEFFFVMQHHFHNIYLQIANMGGSVGQFSHPLCMGAIQDGKYLKWQ